MINLNERYFRNSLFTYIFFTFTCCLSDYKKKKLLAAKFSVEQETVRKIKIKLK